MRERQLIMYQLQLDPLLKYRYGPFLIESDAAVGTWLSPPMHGMPLSAAAVHQAKFC
jgi:hypothetical protein